MNETKCEKLLLNLNLAFKDFYPELITECAL